MLLLNQAFQEYCSEIGFNLPILVSRNKQNLLQITTECGKPIKTFGNVECSMKLSVKEREALMDSYLIPYMNDKRKVVEHYYAHLRQDKSDQLRRNIYFAAHKKSKNITFSNHYGGSLAEIWYEIDEKHRIEFQDWAKSDEDISFKINPYQTEASLEKVMDIITSKSFYDILDAMRKAKQEYMDYLAVVAQLESDINPPCVL
jgi:hypothetical protein